jgi:hypothetical protein
MSATSNPSVRIFVAHHKPFPVVETETYTPIHAGRAVSKHALGMIGDDTGDNISDRNPRYSEASVYYWVWKHLDEIGADYIGLCHYRRYFNFLENWKDRLYNWAITREGGWSYWLNRKSESWGLMDYMRTIKTMDAAFLRAIGASDPSVMLPVLDGRDVVINRAVHCGMTLAEQARRCSPESNDFEKMEEMIAGLYPDWIPWAQECFHRRPTFFNNLMVIAKRDVFRRWLEWMFSILLELEPLVPHYEDPYQERMLSFLVERLAHLYFTRMGEEGGLNIRPLSSFFLELDGV